MSKFLCLGMSLPRGHQGLDGERRLRTEAPELGSLKPGSAGDASILSVDEGTFDYVDVVGEHFKAGSAHHLARRGDPAGVPPSIGAGSPASLTAA